MKRFSAAELKAKRDRGESRTDVEKLKAKTEAELEEEIASDPDCKDLPADWHEAAIAVMPVPKRLISLRLDEEVVEWFRQSGPGYQTRMNAALLAYKRQMEKLAG